MRQVLLPVAMPAIAPVALILNAALAADGRTGRRTRARAPSSVADHLLPEGVPAMP
jgi:hypothetical protein